MGDAGIARGGTAVRLLSGVVGFGMVLMVLLVYATPPASAASKRVFEETFGSAAQPEFVQAQGIAVDYDTGHLYVIDAGAKTLSRWNADGTPANFAALGTNVIDAKKGPGEKPCAEEPESCDWDGRGIGRGDGLVFNTAPAGRRQSQVAVDQSNAATDGNIYLTQFETSFLVEIFDADGSFLGQLTEYKEGVNAEGPLVRFGNTVSRGPCGVAIDEAGAVYVGDSPVSLVHKYVSQGAPHAPLTNADNIANFDGLASPCTMATGAGPSTGYLFAKEQVGLTFKMDSADGEVLGDALHPATNQNTVSVFPGSGNVFVGNGFEEIKELDATGPEPLEVSFAEPATSVRGFAPTPSTDRLYVSREGSAKLEIFSAPLLLPIVVSEPATAVTEMSATVHGSVNPEGLEVKDGDCKFEYITDSAYKDNEAAEVDPFAGASAKVCAEVVGEGTAPVSVHADLTGLEAGELFRYRLSATTEAGTVEGDELTFATTVPPVIEDEHTSSATGSEATIKLLINPKFYATTYHVEYTTLTAFEAEGFGGAQSTPEVAVGADGIAHPLVTSLTVLKAGTTYAWRVVASSGNGLAAASSDHIFTTYRPFVADTGCANQAFRSGPSADLPDCRAYEMVSPVDKNGDGIVVRSNANGEEDAYVKATPDGGKIAYSSAAAFGDQLSSRFYNEYIASRGAERWSNSGVNAPLGAGLPGDQRTEREVNAFTDDLCSMWFFDYNVTPLNPDAQSGFNNLYRRQNCVPGIGGFETLTTSPPLLEGLQAGIVGNWSVQGFSTDGKAVFFTTGAPLTPDAALVGTNRQVYLHHTGDPILRLVSVLPGGGVSPPIAGTNHEVGGGANRNLQNAVSEDGTRVFWTANLSTGGTGSLYLRLNPAELEPVARTIAVSAGTAATFWDATPSGSAALYSEGTDLWRFDTGSENRTKLAEGLFGVAGASDDLARIYLVSSKDYDAGGPAEEGEHNLYLYEGGSFAFIGALPTDEFSGDLGISSAVPKGRPARVSPDGRHLVFQTRAPLTGFDNTEAATGEAVMEVFRYETGNGGSLRCLSCNPAGLRPRARELSRPYRDPNEKSGSSLRAAAWIPTWQQALHGSRVLSGDGNRVFFHSYDPLLPPDTNGTVQDVYQWEAAGTGGCDAGDGNYFVVNGGCIDLISSGESAERSVFVDADEDGSDVFFTTASSLVAGDPGSVDLYDARIGGGYPTLLAPVACEGEACQSPPPTPEQVTPSSAAYSGPGDAQLGNDCRRSAQQAAKLNGQAASLSRRAERAGNPRAASHLRRMATDKARQAKHKSRAAKRCRRANRRAGR